MFWFLLSFPVLSQSNPGQHIITSLPDTILLDTTFYNLSLGYAPGSNFEPDTIQLFYADSIITLLAFPKASVTTLSETVNTPNHNGSGYTLDNGFGVTNDFGYYIQDNGDGTFQLNDWTESLSGDTITSATFGNQAPFEFDVLVADQDSFFDNTMNTLIGETEVYVNGVRLRSSSYTIDTSGTGVILTTGLQIGDYLIIDID
ncbi:MAG: hypothetical protein HKN09_02290 [Saprospiraceae bacterium]|nr:hypothetical protein [Saprospiraceae bacterium]